MLVIAFNGGNVGKVRELLCKPTASSLLTAALVFKSGCKARLPMEYIFGFLFLLIKISIQAFLYTWLLLKLATLYATRNPASWVARVYQQPSVKRRSRLLIGAALFAFSCTYWGNRGLGDSVRIPLGHGEAIEEINVAAYFDASVPYEHPTDQPIVESYQVAGTILCAKAPDDFYFTYDLETKQSRTFTGADAYNRYAASRSLPLASQFQSFGEQYDHYWNGWRFWLLA